MEVPKPNDDISKLILTEKAKDSPYVKKWYNLARKSFIAFVKLYNDKSEVLPEWIYEENQKTELGKLREMWIHFQSVFPTLGFEGEGEDIISLVSKLEESGQLFDAGLGPSCEPWVKYSTALKGFRVKVDDYCMDNMYFAMRRRGQLQFPGEPPREQQKMTYYSDWHDPTSPYFQGQK